MLQFLFLAVAFAELDAEKWRMLRNKRNMCMKEKNASIGAKCPKGNECVCDSHCITFIPGFAPACHVCEDFGTDKAACTDEDLGAKMGCTYDEEGIDGVKCFSVFDKQVDPNDKSVVTFETAVGCNEKGCPKSDTKEGKMKICENNKCFGKGACLVLERKSYTCMVDPKNFVNEASCTSKKGYFCEGAKKDENEVKGRCMGKIEDTQPRCGPIENETLCLKEGMNPISRKGLCKWMPAEEKTDMEKKMEMCMKKEGVTKGMACTGECKCKMVCMDGKCANCEAIKDEDKCKANDHCKYVESAKGNMCVTEDDVVDEDEEKFECTGKIEDTIPRCKDIKTEEDCLKEGMNPISRKGLCLWKAKAEMTDMEKKMMMCMKKEDVKIGMACTGDECKCKMVCMGGKCANCESIKEEDMCVKNEHCKYVKSTKGNMCITEDDVLDDVYKCKAEVNDMQGKCDKGEDKESCEKIRASVFSTKQICNWMKEKEMTEDEKKQMECMKKEQIEMGDACSDKCGCGLACINNKCMRCEKIESKDACMKYPSCKVVGKDDEVSCVTKDKDDMEKMGRCIAKVEDLQAKCSVAKDEAACHKITPSIFSKNQICEWHEAGEMTEEEKKQMECAKKEGMKMGDACTEDCKCGFICLEKMCQRCEKLDGETACTKYKMCKYVKANGEEKAQCVTTDTTVDDVCAGNDSKKACKKLKSKNCKFDKKQKKCMFVKPVEPKASKKTCKKLKDEAKCIDLKGCSWGGKKKMKCSFKKN